MKIWIDRDTCSTTLSSCISCFGQMVLTGIPDRGCVTDFEDNGLEDMIVYMKSGGHEEIVNIPEDMRETVAYEGWDQFVSFKPRFLSFPGRVPIKQ